MKVELLPSSFGPNGRPSARQHLACLVVDNHIAIDAGSLAFAVSESQRNTIRDVVLTHAHLDHVAGLPLFIDDLFATLESPVRIHAANEVIEILERNIFNWDVYPRFSELQNDNGQVVEYVPFDNGEEFPVGQFVFRAIAVNHKVPSFGFIVRGEHSSFALTGDTTSMDTFWDCVNNEAGLQSVLIECAFPNELAPIAERSYHMTPYLLKNELAKLKRGDCDVYVINIKPMYREKVLSQLAELNEANLKVLETGRFYDL